MLLPLEGTNSKTNKSIAVIGIGNILYQDEGVGVYTIKYLEKNYRFYPEISLIDGALLGFSLLNPFQEYEHILVIDTLALEDTPGSIYRFGREQIEGIQVYYSRTAHELGLPQVLNFTRLSGYDPHLVILGVIPEAIRSLEIGLSETLRERAFPKIISLILEELKRWGISFKRVNNLTLEEIVNSLLTQDNK